MPVIAPQANRTTPSDTETPWHAVDVATVFARLDSGATGLTAKEAVERLARHGPNALAAADQRSPWRILAEQFFSTMVIILIMAGAASAVLGDYKDTAVIAAIVVLNAALGFQQEYRAERALRALRGMAAPQARVRRDGVVQSCPAADLVPGDVVLLEAGNLVPADGRVTACVRLRVQEAALTGEAEAVEKDPGPRPAGPLALGDRHNMVYLGTQVVQGRGEVVITATGMATELGHIATLVQSARRADTPLQQRLAQLGRGLAAVALALVGVIVVLGLLRGEDWQLLFLTGVSVAVAAVPEGLPAVVTIALALGAQRMLRRRALIRKLPAVETLGSVTVICTDKTGTLTANAMTVTALAGPEAAVVPPPVEAPPPALGLVLLGGALCNDARLTPEPGAPPDAAAWGDPTETALLRAAAAAGLDPDALAAAFPRVAEMPFDSARKRMTTVHAASPAAWAALGGAPAGLDAPFLAVTKGAVEGLLACSDRLASDAGPRPLDAAARARVESGVAALAGQGMRVLGVAVRPLAALPPVVDSGAVESGLIFAGFLGLEDPLRPEVPAAVATCRAAGIRPVMITGDHPLTAASIARTLHLDGSAGLLTGPELDDLDAAGLEAAVDRVAVYARVTPEHKLRIVEALQRRGAIVAMTGDGVNDAPALKQADIGVAMGRAGTDVAKEAADLVLLDDNFATIVAATEEGRVIYDNVRKFIRYILAGNTGELAVMLAAPLLGLPLPLLPLQILWINLVTDGLPALALGVEPAEHDCMRRPPPRPRASIFAQGLGFDILVGGLLTAAAALLLGAVSAARGEPGWQTLIFTTLTLAQMAIALAVRSERESLWRRGLFTNPALLGAVALTIVLQLVVVYLPPLQDLFHTVPLDLGQLGMSAAAGAVVFALLEGRKVLGRAGVAASAPGAS